MTTPVTIPGFAGIDNVHKPHDGVFQLAEDRLPAMVAAMDMQLDDDGHVMARSPYVVAASSATFRDGVSFGGDLYVQDGEAIAKNPHAAREDVVTGLDPTTRVVFHKHAGELFWVNGATRGRIITGGISANWGMKPSATPTLSTAAGSLVPGLYQVTVTWVDAWGIESGAPLPGQVDVPSDGGIWVTAIPTDQSVVGARIYLSEPNGTVPQYHSEVSAHAFPVLLTTSSPTDSVCQTMHCTAPPSGLSGMASYRGVLYGWRGDTLFHALGNRHHAWDVRRHATRFGAIIRAAQGVDGGLWVATENGLWWMAYSGAGFEAMSMIKKDERNYAFGSALVDGSALWVDTGGRCAVFVSRQDGVVCGTPDGQAVPLTANRYQWADVSDSRCSIVATGGDSGQLIVACGGA